MVARKSERRPRENSCLGSDQVAQVKSIPFIIASWILYPFTALYLILDQVRHKPGSFLLSAQYNCWSVASPSLVGDMSEIAASHTPPPSNV